MRSCSHPLLYEVNTRVWLTQLSAALGRPAILDDIPDSALDRFAEQGFDWIWFLSVWSTGPAGRRVSLESQGWRKDFQATLPDLRDEDIAGSGFAIRAYSVPALYGGDSALARLRERLRERGLRLMLDFVPNHTSLDHAWVKERPDYYIHGTETDLKHDPGTYVRISGGSQDLILAHGRDPYFPGWPDTVQLDYSNPATQQAMISELRNVCSVCDGVRCDMAMLLLPEVFERTWGRKSLPFWKHAISAVRQENPRCCFLAEVYWNLEFALQEEAFDFTYDKRMYDRLVQRSAHAVREHLQAPIRYQQKLARFLENHDEPRAAATFPVEVHRAAALIAYLTPGLRFFHQGQFEGRKKHVSPHLIRLPIEPTDEVLSGFYNRLLSVLNRAEFHEGEWRLLEPSPAWGGNGTWDSFVAFTWNTQPGRELLVVVNYSPQQGQCYVRLPFSGLAGQGILLRDLFNSAEFERSGTDLIERGLYLDMRAWGYQVFELLPAAR